MSGIPPAQLGVLVVLQFLKEQGYTQSLATLEKEAPPRPLNASQLIDSNNHLLVAMESLSAQRAAAAGAEERRERQRREEALTSLTSKQDAAITRCSSTLSNVHICNILALDFCYENNSALMASTASDKSLRVIDFKDEVVSLTHSFPAPIVDVSWNPVLPNLIAASCMNGSVYIVDREELFPLQTSVHSKFVVRVKWSTDGTMLASASHDHMMGLFRVGDEAKLQLVKQFKFIGAVESLAWVGSSSLIVGVRDDHCLHTIDIATLQESTKINLNAYGDDHVSFAPMDICVSNDQKWMVVTTDKHRSIMYEIGHNDQVRNFYGAVNDPLSRGRTVWSLSGSHVYGTSQDRKIVDWDVASSKVISKLEGHKEDVRSLVAHPRLNLLGSVSYDKTIKLWSP